MPFNVLIPTCLHSMYSYHEGRAKILFTKQEKERVLFFIIDDQPIGRSKIREYLGKNSGVRRYDGKICDLLIYYNRDDLDYDIICLVELKQNKADEKEAIDQIIDTHKQIHKEFVNPFGKKVKWYAYITYPNKGGSCQLNNKERKTFLEKSFDKWDCSKNSDITDFLRSNSN